MQLELLKLSVPVQAAIASGYAAYMVSYAGIREHHRSTDVVFIGLVFSLISSAIIAQTSWLGLVGSISLAFIATCAVGIAWRKWGRQWLWSGLRHWNISWTNDDPSALATLSANTKFPVAQIAVQLDDGSWLECRDTSQFNDAPYGPCIIGRNGDVGIYLTHAEDRDGVNRELETVSDEQYGYRITYVPAGRIRQITVRHLASHS